MKNNGFSRLEICMDANNPFLLDARAEVLKKRSKNYFGIEIDDVKHIRVITVDSKLDDIVKKEFQDALTNPVTQKSSYSPLISKDDMDWVLSVTLRPGVKDTTGDTTKDMLAPLIGHSDFNVFSSYYFAIKGSNLEREQIEKIGKEMEANHIVQNFKVYSNEEWNPDVGIGRNTPKVKLNHVPTFISMPLSEITFEGIKTLSEDRQLYLNEKDIPTIAKAFNDPEFLAERKKYGLEGPTDVELEYLAQARSDHCNHNTFNARFNYLDRKTKELTVIENLFVEFIKNPTEQISENIADVVSVLWDNSGVRRFNKDYYYVITSETHNSPSNMEAYGGAITGIVGVYRDPLGTGKSSKLIAGSYGFCVGPRDYKGNLQPFLHPQRLQDGVIEGVKDGGNKSGIPTIFGFYYEEPENIAKSNIFVTAIGLMPVDVLHKPAYEKEISPGDLIVMSGGRVGKDGIHGVTAASEGLDENTPAGHVQIGDPYTQKKMHDFINEARDMGYLKFITDNGGGGLSSSIGEASREKNSEGKTGAEVWLDKVPLKYDGLDQWEIWVSESQERMTTAVRPQCIDDFLKLSEKHGVESAVIGEFNNSNTLRIKYGYKTCAYIPTKLLEEEFPQWEFDAEWVEPEERGLYEPEKICELINKIADHGKLFKNLLKMPNIASKEWITRQYDHEVQGTSVIKPLVGIDNDIPSDAAVIRPDLTSEKGFVFTQNVKQKYSKIDTYHMVTASIDEAVRSILAVGGDLDHLSGMDNFCYPSIQPGDENPDAKHKAAQLVRANVALKELCLLYNNPLLSGKDSMYIDNTMDDIETGKKVRMSGLATMQYSLVSTIDDVSDCLSCDAKETGNLIYVIGATKNELGGSEYYAMLGEVGLNIPKTDSEHNLEAYKGFVKARQYVDTVKVVKEGGLAVHLFEMAAGGNLGVNVNLQNLLIDDSVNRDDIAMYSESTGRLIVEVREENRMMFESEMGDSAACIGKFTESRLIINGLEGNEIMNENIYDLKKVWKSTHGDR